MSPGAVTAVPPPYDGTFACVVDTEFGHLPMSEAHALAVGSSVSIQRSHDWSMRDNGPDSATVRSVHKAKRKLERDHRLPNEYTQVFSTENHEKMSLDFYRHGYTSP